MYSVARSGADRVVTIAGDLDLVNAARLLTVIESLDAADGTVYLDLRECEFMDSTAIGVLVKLRNLLGERFCVITRDDGNVRRLLKICGLLDILGAALPAEPIITSDDPWRQL